KEPAGSQKRRDAWEAALDVPLRMAQTCQDLHHVVAPLQKECHPVVLVDLEIGTRLLLDGLDAGVRAGKANMKEWRSELDAAAASERDRHLEALGRKRAWQEMQVEKE
ncbi:MAG TPA: cyclodeaminase/cyclohydrolase family protein, partial [Anaerolineae bacterium]|nr:cyclodeaminase/cyclohydrolase family protein [Anaerolineae bacterium]